MNIYSRDLEMAHCYQSDARMKQHRACVDICKGLVLSLAFMCFLLSHAGVAFAIHGKELRDMYKISTSAGSKKHKKDNVQQVASTDKKSRTLRKPKQETNNATELRTKVPAKQVPTEIDISSELAVGKVPDTPMSFSDCIRLALQQSPYFVESSMKIKKSEFDESDAFYNLLPDLIVETGYVLFPEPTSGNRFKLSFSAGNYDPIAAGFSIKATALLTDVAINGHIRVISEKMSIMGEHFVKAGKHEELIACQDELIALARHKKAYLTNLLESGGANPLDIRVAEQELSIAMLERERYVAEQKIAKSELCALMGVPPEHEIELSFEDVRGQVIGMFNPSNYTLADVLSNSFEVRIGKQLEEVGKFGVKLAWADFIPKLELEMRTTDPIDTDNDNDNGFYTSVGFKWLAWDWGDRYRNVKRRRADLKLISSKRAIGEVEVTNFWRKSLVMEQATLSSLKVASAQAELAGLRKRQSEISYQAGSQPFPVYLHNIQLFFEARKAVLEQELEHTKYEFFLRALSGHLANSYLDIESY